MLNYRTTKRAETQLCGIERERPSVTVRNTILFKVHITIIIMYLLRLDSNR